MLLHNQPVNPAKFPDSMEIMKSLNNQTIHGHSVFRIPPSSRIKHQEENEYVRILQVLAKPNEPIYRDGIANEHDKQVREIRKFLINHIESQGWFESTSLTKMVNILNFAKPEAEEWATKPTMTTSLNIQLLP
jgi:hypothetical protein